MQRLTFILLLVVGLLGMQDTNLTLAQSSEPGRPAPSTAPGTPATTTATTAPALALHVVQADQALPDTLGSTAAGSSNRMEVQLTAWGAGIQYIHLNDYFENIKKETHYVIASPLEALDESTGRKLRVYAFAARAITVNGQRIDVQASKWKLAGKGHYTLTIADATDQPVLLIERKYTLGDGKTPSGYELICNQTIVNLSKQSLEIIWEQSAQGDLPSDADYQGDRRGIVHGYFDLDYNPSRQFVYSNKTFNLRSKYFEHITPQAPSAPMWPTLDLKQKNELVWVATLNRYFVSVVHRPVIEATATTAARGQPLDEIFPGTGIESIGSKPATGPDTRAAVITLVSRAFSLPAQGTLDLSLNLYAGPRKSEIFNAAPYSTLTFSDLIRYELGCTWFTFQPIARGLLWILKSVHVVVRDWAVSIIILVLMVRLILHPITKRAQINMMRMGKQMQTLQPEMEKIKAKYKDDQNKMNAEVMKLYREKGVNPAGFLGCLPMFLQMPIWVALYAMLYFAIELRHQPAFYSIFQTVSGNRWSFLADLSVPDHFIKFSDTPIIINFPLLSSLDFSAINILPILMAVVFYVQQKLTQPPPANEQAEQQQKIMLISTMLFPIFLYTSPSGLTLYIMASTLGGIIDGWIVRRHIKREEEAGTLFKPRSDKPTKPGGFMDRFQKLIEEKQKAMQQQQKHDRKDRKH